MNIAAVPPIGLILNHPPLGDKAETSPLLYRIIHVYCLAYYLVEAKTTSRTGTAWC